MERREHDRVELERQRMRRLLAEGVITAQDLQKEGFSETQRSLPNRKSPTRQYPMTSCYSAKGKCKSAGPARRKKVSINVHQMTLVHSLKNASRVVNI